MIWEVLSLIGCKVDEIGDTAKSIASDFDTLLDDIADITVSGVSSMVTGEGDIECASDIEAEANQIVRKANDKYELAAKNTEKELKILRDMQKKLYKRKVAVAQNLCKSIEDDLHIPMQINAFEINEEIYIEQQLPSIWKIPLYMSRSGILLDGAIRVMGASERISQAKQNRSRAKDYDVKIAGEIAKLKRIDASILRVKSVLNEEDEILKVLECSALQKRSLEKKKVVETLEILLAESVIDENGHENQKYKSAIYELKRMI